MDLPETVQVDENMLCLTHTHEASIPHSWYSVKNTKKYNLGIKHYPQRLKQVLILIKLSIPELNYTASELTTGVETQLNKYVDTVDRPSTYTLRYS